MNFEEEFYNSNLDALARDYRKRYNNGLITSAELKKILLAIQAEDRRRKGGKK